MSKSFIRIITIVSVVFMQSVLSVLAIDNKVVTINFDEILNQFDQIIGLDYLKVVHLNDSKNMMGAHKDRHENLGHGYLGFENILKIAHHPYLQNKPIILETPYIEDKPPYKEEIEMIQSKTFINIK